MNQTTDTDHDETYIQVTNSVAGRLPAEILRLILYQLVECDPSTDPNFFGNVPHELCLVNRHWNRAFTPLLYAHYRFYSQSNQIKGLWCFLRTLYNNPEVAKHVRYLVLRDEKPNLDDSYLDDSNLEDSNLEDSNLEDSNLEDSHISDEVCEELISLSRENLHWVRTALDDAGLGLFQPFMNQILLQVDAKCSASDKMLLWIRSRDKLYELYMRTLTALVAAHCPNLVRLHLQFKRLDQFMRHVFRRATSYYDGPRRHAFQNLNTLTIGETHMEEWDQYIGTDNRYQYLPKLKELVVPHGVVTSSLHLKETRPPNAIERLTLGFTRIETRPFGSYLHVMSNLKQLTVNLNTINETLFGLPDPDDYIGFWEVLQTLHNQLEYLELFESVGKDMEFCASLSEFSKLRCLVVPVRLITSGPCNHGEPTKMQSHLPPNIESLGLYEQGNKMYWDIDRFKLEIRGIGTWTRQPGRKIRAIYCDWYDFEGEPLRKVMGLEDHKGIAVHYSELGAFFEGGKDTVAAWLSRWSNDSMQGLQAEFLRHRARHFIPQGMIVHDQNGLL